METRDFRTGRHGVREAAALSVAVAHRLDQIDLAEQRHDQRTGIHALGPLMRVAEGRRRQVEQNRLDWRARQASTRRAIVCPSFQPY
ncbi:hypothetical protein [Methylorubrum extorquens]|uniref:Uncharacterized protein n=1 Tax=Methylorubrum extorquens TaxID=408 RepID=A0AAX3WC92_METEX|nr:MULTISPECIES: hypothetical protein [Methylobacteriaceae]KQO94049.1 hypothetical protein ASF33_14865 [Methylobacterium sp. Leaf92]KQQ23313.1 hypothetical protein ASF56_17275 [Methylobacterium sp. Leaf122]WHQ68971.1 hypothetical protein KEC54_21910 [Methylorubrum extorquens]